MGKTKLKNLSKKRWSQIIDQLSTMEPPRLEEREQCFHTHLQKIIKDNVIYQCQNPKCGSVIEVVGARVLTPQQFAAESAIINMTIAENDPAAMDVLQRFVEEMLKEEDSNDETA